MREGRYHTVAAQLVAEITTTAPTRAMRVLSKWRKSEKVHTEMTVEEVLSLMIASELFFLTKSENQSFRRRSLSHDEPYEFYPSHNIIALANRRLTPKELKYLRPYAKKTFKLCWTTLYCE